MSKLQCDGSLSTRFYKSWQTPDCESQYHIKVANVKRLRRHRADLSRDETPGSMGSEHHSSGNPAAAQLIKHVIGLSERAFGDPAANFPCCGHGKDLA